MPGSSGRRKQKKINEDSSTTEVGGKSTNDTNSTSLRNNNSSKESTISTITQSNVPSTIPQATHNDNNRCNERQRRQMRMFKVILVLMCVFIAFRLPSQIYLLYKLSFYIEPKRAGWIVMYALSFLGLLNSMMNPFLYTFLSESIRLTARIRESCDKFFKLCPSKESQQQQNHYANNEVIFDNGDAKNALDMRASGGVYLGN